MPSLVPAAEQKGLCHTQCIILCKWHARIQEKTTETENTVNPVLQYLEQIKRDFKLLGTGYV